MKAFAAAAAAALLAGCLCHGGASAQPVPPAPPTKAAPPAKAPPPAKAASPRAPAKIQRPAQAPRTQPARRPTYSYAQCRRVARAMRLSGAERRRAIADCQLGLLPSVTKG